MQKISYILFRAVVFLISQLPFKLLYFLSDILRFFLKDILRYRLSVIDKNLKFCFPEKSNHEIKHIRDTFYKNFVDIILESIKGFTYCPKKLVSKYKLINPEILESYFDSEQNIIILSQHFNNWEWGSICLGLQTQHRIVGVVKRISNQYIDRFISNSRSKNNVSIVPADDTGRYIKYHKPDKPEGLVFIADQYPYNKRHRKIASFFDKQIAFHSGTPLMSKLSNYPIFFIDIYRINRGEYELKLIKLAEGHNTLTPQDITAKYAAHLETLIQQYPAGWLWSHKRFKDEIAY